MIDYINESLSLLDRPEFYEATAEELRVLVALQAKQRSLTVDELVELLNISSARAASALAYWENAGFALSGRSITAEFENEQLSLNVAKTIRDHNLKALIDQCAALLGRPIVTSSEIKLIVDLYQDCALSEEFIVTLLTDMCSRSKTSVKALHDRATKFFKEGIDTPEKLNAYFQERDSKTEGELLVKRLLGIWNRNLSPTEKSRSNKWVNEFGYTEEVIGTAYDLAPRKGEKGMWTFMDRVLTQWHDNNLQTQEACLAYYEANKKTPSKSKEKPRYGNFDPEEAFQNALKRSYGEDYDRFFGDKSKEEN